MSSSISSTPGIEAMELQYTYGNGNAVDGISLSIAEGEFFGLLGPNGAGKSTTIHMLSALLKPHSGQIHFFGKPLDDNLIECKRWMGVVPQEIALYDELSALDNLIFWGRLYGLSLSQCRRRAVNLLRLTGLRDRAYHLIKTYSGGMKRRINIAAALMHEPRILLMDEPTVGVDPQSRIHIFDLLAQLHQDGMTIIYTTHYMEEVERLCKRVAIIDHGKIIADGSLESLKDISRNEAMVVIETDTYEIEKDFTWADILQLPVDRQGNSLNIMTPTPQKDLPGLIERLQEKGIGVLRAEIKEPNLETVFLKLTGRSLRD